MAKLIVALITLAAFITPIVLFRAKIGQRLAFRITTSVFATTIGVALVIVVLGDSLLDRTGREPNPGSPLMPLLIFTFLAVITGITTSWLINRPLKHFTRAIRSLESSKYKGDLPYTGIKEFDQVFNDFNKLAGKLRAEEELRKNLISDTSHELNTPLTAMIGQLTAMQDGTLPITKKRIDTLKTQTDRLWDLVQQLDTYTRARTTINHDVKSVNLKNLCQEVISQMDGDLRKNSIIATLKIADDLELNADPIALQQILINLIQNTCRYSGAKVVTIAADSKSLTFYDDGKGVPIDSLPHLFDRFYRVDTSRNRNNGGLGLGLTIVAELVERHNWQIHAEAAQPGLAIVIRF